MSGSAVSDYCKVTSNEKRTLVLLGRTGNEKSATGNSILGGKAFNSKYCFSGVTTTCELQRARLHDGLTIEVIDTPGLFGFSDEPGFIGQEIVQCMDLAKDGIHAVLLVLSLRTGFSSEEQAAVQTFQEFFGEKLRDYMIVVFTCGDELEDGNRSLDEYLDDGCPEPLKETIKMCDSRLVLFDNRTKDPKKKADQLKHLLSLVNRVLKKNGGDPYTNELSKELKALKVNSLIDDSKRLTNELKEPKLRSYEEQLARLTENVISVSRGVSETESGDIMKAVEQRKKELEKKSVSEKSTFKESERKQPKRRVKVTAKRMRDDLVEQGTVDEEGPGHKNKKEKDKSTLTREERVNVLKTQKVLNGRVFDPEIKTQPRMCDLSDAVELQTWTHLFVDNNPVLHEEQVREFYYNMVFEDDLSLSTQVGERKLKLNETILGKILRVPNEGIRSVSGRVCTKRFLDECRKLPNLSGAGILKKFLKGVYQLFFEFVNKVLLPRTEKRTIASGADLFMIEALSKFEAINLPAIILEHMHKIITVKDGKHGMGYCFLLTKVFSYFGVPLGVGVKGTVKQTFTQNTLIECECVEGKIGQVSRVSELLAEQEHLKKELENMTTLLSKRDAEITLLKAQLTQAKIEGPGAEEVLMLRTQNESLNAQVENLKDKLLNHHVESAACLSQVIQSLTHKLPSS